MPLCISKDVYFQRIFLVFHAHISHDLGFALFELPCPLLSLVCIAHEPLEPRMWCTALIFSRVWFVASGMEIRP